MNKQVRKSLLGSSTKVEKGEKFGYLSGIMYLAPHSLSGKNICPHASDGCKAVCLYQSGHGIFNRTQKARIAKTQYVTSNRDGFNYNIDLDIAAIERKAAKLGWTACVRLNGTSDMSFTDVYKRNPDTIFYDYTPNPFRYAKYLQGDLPSNYHLTFSRKENNSDQVDQMIALGKENGSSVSIAVCFTSLPKTYKGLQVIDGDESDLRFLDPSNVIVGLTFKGTKANRVKAIASGFCVDSAVDQDCTI